MSAVDVFPTWFRIGINGIGESVSITASGKHIIHGGRLTLQKRRDKRGDRDKPEQETRCKGHGRPLGPASELMLMMREAAWLAPGLAAATY